MLSPRTEELASEVASAPATPVLLQLRFDEDVSATVRSRISYAFRVFAAVYGYRVAETSESKAVTIFYGNKPSDAPDQTRVPARYHADLPKPSALELTARRYANEDFYLFFGVDRETQKPDWLGEIFEWLSCSHERRISERDSIGRVPFSESVFAQKQISPRKPYAMLAMAWLQNELTNSGGAELLPKPPSPAPNGEHLVVCSHDIDYYYSSKSSALARLLKNLVIAIQTYRSWPFFAWNARQLFNVLRGKRLGEYFRPLFHASRKYGFCSTIFAVSNRGHRRDPDYQLDDLPLDGKTCAEYGFSIGLHGSYQSINQKADLLSETSFMQATLSVRPRGVRQHWLRFGNHETFFATIEKADFVYDSTLGFAEAAGFRNGACFAFPPYDFKNEKPYPFLEIPLVLMDGSVEASARSSGESPDAIAEEILAESRKWGWGGIAADWHNPIEPIQVPDEINRIFWKQVSAQKSNGELWISAEQFLDQCVSRYQDAGLLTGVRLNG